MRWWVGVLCAAILVGGSTVIVIWSSASARHQDGSGRFLPEGASSGRPGAGLHVIPFPGTPDAPASSQIIFSSLARAELASLRVTGSLSGRHSGRLETLPDRAGTAFVPAHRFTPGEQVSVRAVLSSRAAGRASGDPGSRRLSFSFGVDLPATPPPVALTGASGAMGRTRSFHSEPGLHPPVVRADADSDHDSGDIFLSPNRSPQSGNMILNRRGQLVWFHPVSSTGRLAAFNLQVQRYRGRPVLTWWQGRVAPEGHSPQGEDVIVDRHYRTVAVVHAGDGYSADLHEFVLTPRGTALLDSYVPVQADLTSLGGPRHGSVYDCVIQELDVRTGRVLWEWHALGHVPLDTSYRRPSGSQPFDFFHLNSIQVLQGERLLISARNTWAAYEISMKTGRVIWTLGGKRSSFRMGPGTNFEWQHDVERRGHLLTVFNDAWDGVDNDREEKQSSAKALSLRGHTVTLVQRYGHHPSVLSSSLGNIQVLPDNDVFVGWGSDPDFSEYAPSGRQIFNGTFDVGVTSYRAYRFTWSGRPSARPAIALGRGPHRELRVWASWNGATDVAAWRLLGGPSATVLNERSTVPKRGFETQITLRTAPGYCAAQALNGRGQVLGTSAVRPCRPS
jgi:hypothetical protein